MCNIHRVNVQFGFFEWIIAKMMRNQSKSYANWFFMILFVLGCIGVKRWWSLQMFVSSKEESLCAGENGAVVVRRSCTNQTMANSKVSCWWICCWCDWLWYWKITWVTSHRKSVTKSTLSQDLNQQLRRAPGRGTCMQPFVNWWFAKSSCFSACLVFGHVLRNCSAPTIRVIDWNILIGRRKVSHYHFGI